MASNNSDGKLSWDDFREMIQVLLPMNLEDQITLFLQAYVPSDLIGEEIDKFKFTIQDVLKISETCLAPNFKITNDEFFSMLCVNYTKMICRIVGMDFNEDPNKPPQKISLRRLKKNLCKAEGYEKDMLTLLYGLTGILELTEKTKFKPQGAEYELRNLSKL